jgi:hypothetical protein
MADFLVRGRRRRCHIMPVDTVPAARYCRISYARDLLALLETSGK